MPREPKPPQLIDAFLYKVGGLPQAMKVPRGAFAPFYALLGCDTIEVVRLDKGHVMLIDENGKVLDKPKNEMATTRARGHIMDTDYIVGDALVCSKSILSKGR